MNLLKRFFQRREPVVPSTDPVLIGAGLTSPQKGVSTVSAPAPAPWVSRTKSHPCFGKRVSATEIRDLIDRASGRSTSLRALCNHTEPLLEIFEILLYADLRSSIEMSMHVGYYCSNGFCGGLFINDRSPLQDDKALMLYEAANSLRGEICGDFVCNYCGKIEGLSLRSFKLLHDYRKLSFSPPPENPLLGIRLGRQHIDRLNLIHEADGLPLTGRCALARDFAAKGQASELVDTRITYLLASLDILKQAKALGALDAEFGVLLEQVAMALVELTNNDKMMKMMIGWR